MDAGSDTRVSDADGKEAVLRHLSRGSTIVAAFREPGMGDRSRLQRWLHEDLEFRTQYLIARVVGAEWMVQEGLEDLLDRSEDTISYTTEAIGPDGVVALEVTVPNGVGVKRRMAAVQQRNWLAGKWDTRAYGRVGELIDATIAKAEAERDLLKQIGAGNKPVTIIIDGKEIRLNGGSAPPDHPGLPSPADGGDRPSSEPGGEGRKR